MSQQIGPAAVSVSTDGQPNLSGRGSGTGGGSGGDGGGCDNRTVVVVL